MAMVNELQILKEIDDLVRRAGSQSQAAKLLGVSRQMLNQVIIGIRPPGKKIPRALRSRRAKVGVRLYERA